MENVKIPIVTKKSATDKRIEQAIAESEKILADDPKWVPLDKVLKELDKI